MDHWAPKREPKWSPIETNGKYWAHSHPCQIKQLFHDTHPINMGDLILLTASG